MALTDPLDALGAGDDGKSDADNRAARYSMVQSALLKGIVPESTRSVVVITLNEEVKEFFKTSIRRIAQAKKYRYIGEPKISDGVEARVVIMDVTPATDARLHTQYDRIVRMKKGLGKRDDVIAVFGPRERYRSYRRGTYPGLLYFCLDEKDLNRRDPDLPIDGLTTVEGPTLYNFVDLPAVIAKLL